MTDTGASIQQTNDPRFSRAINWGIGLLGTLVVLVLTWIGTSINALTVAVTQGTERIEFLARTQVITEQRLDTHDSRLNKAERDIAVIEGRVFRGVQGYQEASRGR